MRCASLFAKAHIAVLIPAFTNHQFIGYAVKKPQAMANCIRNQNSIRDGAIGPNHTNMTSAIQPYMPTCP